MIGLLAGALGGLFGVGGGLIFVPALVLLFGLGQVDAEATSLLAIIPVVVAGTWRQHLYGNVRWRAALVIGVVAVAGVELGVLTAKSLSEETLQRLFAAPRPVVAAQLAWRAHDRASPRERRHQKIATKPAAVSATLSRDGCWCASGRRSVAPMYRKKPA